MDFGFVFLLFMALAHHGDGKPYPTDLKIAVFNSMTFHHEVLAGVLTVMTPLMESTTVYTRKSLMPGMRGSYGFQSLLPNTTYRYVPIPIRKKELPSFFGDLPRYDLLIFVSPEYAVSLVKRFIAVTQPIRVLLFVHHADSANLVQLPHKRRGAKSSLTKVTMAALSPHVARSLVRNLTSIVPARPPSASKPQTMKARMKKTAKVVWMTPTALLQPELACGDIAPLQHAAAAATASGWDSIQQPAAGSNATSGNETCVAGFSLQGMLDTSRRNYSGLWDEMRMRYNTSEELRSNERFRVRVLGSGHPSMLPDLGPILKVLVSIHCNLPYPQFYETIYHTLALLPSFSSKDYYSVQFSSTVATSLTTGVPMIATHQLLRAYSFLDPSTTFLQLPGETTVDVMLRILAMPQEEVWRTRRALRDLRIRLNSEARDRFLELVRMVEKAKRQRGLKDLRLRA